MKKVTLITDTVSYLFLLIVHLIPPLNKLLNYLLDIVLKFVFELNIDVSQTGKGIETSKSILFVIPLTILFTFIIRSIDWHNEHLYGGLVWIWGSVIALVFFIAGSFIIDKTCMSVIYWVYIVIGYLICVLAALLPPDLIGPGNTTGFGPWDFG